MFQMALEAFLDSNFHLAAPSPGLLQSSSSDNSLEEHGQYQAAVASLLNASSGNFQNTSSRIANLNVGIASMDTNSNSMESSLVTDAKSAFPGGPNMLRSAIANMGTDVNIHSLPALFSSGSSIVSGASTAQQISHLAPKKPQVAKKKQQKGITAMSRQGSQKLQNSLPCGIKQDPISLIQRQKKPRLDITEEAIPDQYISQQQRLTHDSVQLQRHTQPLPSLVQHHANQNASQQKVSPSMPQLHGVLMQPQQPQMRNQLQEQVGHRVSNRHQFDIGACTRRLMHYLYHLRNRPPDNNLAYWRNFVREYFAPGAKKRWCVSLYDKVGLEAIGVSPNAAMGTWKCDVCGCSSGRGFEVKFELLPRLNKLTFESGVIEELLFFDLPQAYNFPSGLIMLAYGKAVQERVYEKLRVVHEGQLRILFTPDLKIASWLFCVVRHEVFVPRSLVASQMVHAAQKYQSSINDSGLHTSLPHDSQTKSNQIQNAGSWLWNALDLQLVDDWGFSKSYTRCMQIAEVVDSMKDLMTFCLANQVGPIESLKNHCRGIATSKLHKHFECRDLPTNKMPVFPVATTKANDGSNITRERLITGSEHRAALLPGYNHTLGCESLSSRLTDNFTFDGLSSSPRCNQMSEQDMFQKIMEMMNNRTVNEVDGQVANFPTSIYSGKEPAAAFTPENSFWRTDNLPAGLNADFSKSAPCDPSLAEDQF